MANPKFYAVDVSQHTFTTSQTENTSFPLANLKDYMPGSVWKPSNAVTPQYLMIDIGATLAAAGVDFLVLDGDNFFSYLGDTNAILEAANDSAYSSGLATVVADVANASGARVYEFTSSTKRYYRIKLLSPDSNVQIGTVFIGKKFDWGYPYDFPKKANMPKYQTSQGMALNGILRTSQPFAGRKMWEMNFSMLPDATWTTFMTVFQTIRGRLRPFYFADVDGSLTCVHMDTDLHPGSGRRYQMNDFQGVNLMSQSTS